jgi:GNAT superfamily N-acetyltransferase
VLGSHLVVRGPLPDELPLVGDLCVAAYRAVGHLDEGDPYAETLRDAGGRAATAVLLVAVRDGVVVGSVTICPAGSPFAEIGRAGESEFRFLAVEPGAWRSGVGEALVAACEEWAVSHGKAAHVICVVDGNQSAHRFYERLGFERLPERDWSPRPGVSLHAYRREVPHVPAADKN